MVELTRLVESSCDNKEIIETNIRSVKISSPDVSGHFGCSSMDDLMDLSQYKNWDPDKAVEDYYTRIRDHEKYYEPIEDRTWPFIRILNVSAYLMMLIFF